MDKDELLQYVNTVCEIKTMDNELLVLGQVYQVLDSLSLSMDIISKDGTPMPGSHYGFSVKVCLHSGDSLLILGGRVYLSNPTFWRISNLSNLQDFERRGLFRVPARIPAKVRLFNMLTLPGEPEDEGADCKLVDISLSGVKFATERFFDDSSRLELVSLMLPEDPEPYTLACEIVRREENNATGYVYRCKFIELTPKLSDRLCKAIFVLQRNSIRRQRARI